MSIYGAPKWHARSWMRQHLLRVRLRCRTLTSTTWWPAQRRTTTIWRPGWCGVGSPAGRRRCSAWCARAMWACAPRRRRRRSWGWPRPTRPTRRGGTSSSCKRRSRPSWRGGGGGVETARWVGMAGRALDAPSARSSLIPAPPPGLSLTMPPLHLPPPPPPGLSLTTRSSPTTGRPPRPSSAPCRPTTRPAGPWTASSRCAFAPPGHTVPRPHPGTPSPPPASSRAGAPPPSGSFAPPPGLSPTAQ